MSDTWFSCGHCGGEWEKGASRADLEARHANAACLPPGLADEAPAANLTRAAVSLARQVLKQDGYPRRVDQSMVLTAHAVLEAAGLCDKGECAPEVHQLERGSEAANQ